MQVLVEMSSSEPMQPPVTVGGNTDEVTFLVPLVAPPPKQDGQSKATKEGSEQQTLARAPRNGFQGKRRNSFNIGFKHPAPFKRRRRVNSECEPVLPSKFLLGGNIFDPLNLNSLLDEEVNRTLNAETPKSSPLPSRNRDPVEILIPKDITDPLSLNAVSGDVELLLSPLKSGRKRHRHRHHPTNEATIKVTTVLEKETEPIPEELRPYELNTTINCRDEVVPLPSLETEGAPQPSAVSATAGSRHRKRRRTSSKSEGKQGSPERIKSGVTVASRIQCIRPQCAPKMKNRFQYGNYCRYYGYRNPNWTEDARLRALRPEWFQGKAVLDIGCNVGHLTLCVAKNTGASRVVGLDIDGALVQAARHNIRHYLSERAKSGSVFPSALVTTRGPIAAPSYLPKGEEEKQKDFPHNVVFVQGNYVVEQDELVEAQKAEFDVILCLSVTKWVHLNWGDDGLKRLFRRMYNHLNPGGVLVIEPQPWSSYGKRKRLTETIFRNFSKISFKPHQFTSYLLSSKVGFSSYELIDTPHTQAKGFQRPIYAFYKNTYTMQETPRRTTQGEPPTLHHSTAMLQEVPTTATQEETPNMVQEQPTTTMLQKPPATATQEETPATTMLQKPPATATQEETPPTTMLQKPPPTAMQEGTSTMVQKQPATIMLQEPPATAMSEETSAMDILQEPAATATPEEPPATTMHQEPPATATLEKTSAMDMVQEPPAAAMLKEPLATATPEETTMTPSTDPIQDV
ncbi:7SK snRNA methylphosphate capping enzyme [Pelobates fuscus]|uniref:7SK snRNA methylphosphate capping enzyme n=1 Tax=Pelobates fuscus TaxID=191477 RepID=UPI002FE4F748